MLAARLADTQSRDVFPSESGQPYLVTSLDHLHSEVRPLLQLPKDGVIHSLRHTYGTRLGEGRADAFNYHEANGAFEPDGIPALCSPVAGNPEGSSGKASGFEPQERPRSFAGRHKPTATRYNSRNIHSSGVCKSRGARSSAG
jgi:hypothetical protein